MQSAESSLVRIRDLLALGGKDFLIEVQKGNIAGHSMVHKFGRNDNVPMNSWAFINLLGFTDWPLSAPTTVRIKAGGDAADVAGGAGAREITVLGLDDSFNEVEEAIATNGVNVSAATATAFWRIYRAWVSAVGTYGVANTTAVTVENSGGGTDVIQIGAGEGQTQFGGWTVSLGKSAYLMSLHMHVDSKKIANIRMFTREDIDDVVAPMKSKRLKLFFDGVIGNVPYRAKGPEIKIPQKTDIWLEAFGDAATAEVACDFELLVVDN
ncbi:hypothetical protein LCGC14_1378350 [marine sediment metagenome]|uniref:Uncharacterized protein n=1 Tax=marine sediment metagenome TaxID=412755 RepID=A0A0F9K3S1_9ZZZZ